MILRCSKSENMLSVRKIWIKRKSAVYSIVIPFNYTIARGNSFQIGTLVTEIRSFGEMHVQFHDVNLLAKYDQYEKTIVSQTILVFDFTSLYQILSNSVD